MRSLEKCAVRSPDGCYRAHIATVYYISKPPLSQNPPSTPTLYSNIEHNRIKNQTESYSRVWPRIYARDVSEHTQQVVRAGLEPRNAGLRIRCADHLATLCTIHRNNEKF